MINYNITENVCLSLEVDVSDKENSRIISEINFQNGRRKMM